MVLVNGSNNMPLFNARLKTLETISRSPIHQSLATPASHVAMARCRTSSLNDPEQAMDVLRSLVQPAIDEEIRRVMQGFVEKYFTPAANNARANLGDDKVSKRLVEEACVSALEHAKSVFVCQDDGVAESDDKKMKCVKRKVSVGGKVGFSAKKKRFDMKPNMNRPNTDLILVSKTGRPVRREGPKWEENRLTYDTLFILGSKANKALGFGQTRGRLYIKHPTLFKYSGDQEDKEWLAKSQLMTTTGGKAYLMVLSDILELARSPDYASHPRQQPNELVGFTVPPFMVDKMNLFISTVRTDPNMSDDQLIKEGELQIAKWEEERKRLAASTTKREEPAEEKFVVDDIVAKVEEECSVKQILNEIKTEEAAAGDHDDLGFLHGMNLSNLVREFEMEAATGNGSQHLAILSLADDNVEGAFPELPEEEEEESQEKVKKETIEGEGQPPPPSSS